MRPTSSLSTVSAPVESASRGRKKPPALVGVPTRKVLHSGAGPPIRRFPTVSIGVVAEGAVVCPLLPVMPRAAATVVTTVRAQVTARMTAFTALVDTPDATPVLFHSNG